ncbi:YraN family protein [Sphingosinicellaceae bacterium]|nr:YraN family protein [Sphingosinicellaceae bacterium]
MRDTASRNAAERRGRRAEGIAAWWLRCHGYAILARRARVPGGEVDLVVRRGHTLVFVEVKARATLVAGQEALRRADLRRVARAAEILAARYGDGCTTTRIDAIIVLPWKWPVHLRSIWSGDW